MAKFGDQPEGYDPFNTISNQLSSLKNPPAAKPKPAVRPEAAETTPPEQAQEQAVAAPVAEKVAQNQIETSRSGGVAATERTEQLPAARPAVRSDSSIELKVMKRFRTTQMESVRIDQATLNLAAKLGVGVEISKITRALWDIYLKHEDDIMRSARPEMIDRKPSNRDTVGMAEFEKQLTDMIEEGLMVASMRARRNS